MSKDCRLREYIFSKTWGKRFLEYPGVKIFFLLGKSGNSTVEVLLKVLIIMKHFLHYEVVVIV